MMHGRHRGGSVILVTLLIALALVIFPLPGWAKDFRPQWATLTLIYWCIALPQRVGVFTGWTVGLALDVLTGTLLGQHALGLSLVAFLALKLHQRIRVFPIWQQAMIVFLLLLVERLFSLWVMGAVHLPPPPLWYWVPPFVGMLLWPWIFAILRAVRQHYHVS